MSNPCTATRVLRGSPPLTPSPVKPLQNVARSLMSGQSFSLSPWERAGVRVFRAPNLGLRKGLLWEGLGVRVFRAPDASRLRRHPARQPAGVPLSPSPLREKVGMRVAATPTTQARQAATHDTQTSSFPRSRWRPSCRRPALERAPALLPAREESNCARSQSIQGDAALHPLLGERQSLPRTRSGLRPSPAEAGEGSSGQPTSGYARVSLLERVFWAAAVALCRCLL